MKIPRIVKYTLINLVKLTLFIAACMTLALAVGFLIEFVKLNDISPLWVIVPIILAAMIGFSVKVARFDVERDELRDQRIANRLSRED
jgi:hypothetical protein